MKLDFLFPTGSFKDRGSALLISKLRSLGVSDILDDSSGNAGASTAAYAAAAGIRCTIYSPAGNSPNKLAQIAAYGAKLVPIAGDRDAVADATREAARTRFYASHNWHPIFLVGVSTLGFEIWEQLGRRAPEAIIAPAGQGTILLGLWRAFSALRQSGAVTTIPRLYAVQSANFPSLAEAWEVGASIPRPSQHGPTIAEGIACRLPLRGAAVLEALRESNGGALSVTEVEIQNARRLLAEGGYYVEPTSATAGAGFRKLLDTELDPDGSNVIVLTGSGLKSSPVAGSKP
jgi:threonine synthase